MARIIKKSKKRGRKKATRKATIKTVTKRVYVKAKKATALIFYVALPPPCFSFFPF